MTDVFYFDSSALVKLLVEERESDALRRAAAHSSVWATSVVAEVEVGRAVRVPGDRRLALRTERLFESLEVVGLDRQVVQVAARVEPASLRSLDAIHVATALSLAPVAAFFAYDRRLGEAAERVGLPLTAPS